jgi:hypothetical protein
MTKLKLTLLAGAATLSLMRVAAASPIVFTYIIANASGTIGSTPFTDQLITISAVADTADIVPSSEATEPCCSFGFSVENSSASVTIGSLGTFTFVTGTRFGVGTTPFGTGIDLSRSASPGVDLNDGPSYPASSPFYSVLSNWNMTSSIGPLTSAGVVSLLQWSAPYCISVNCTPRVTDVVTSGGVLVLGSNSNPFAPTTYTFSAVVPPVFAGTPGKSNCHGQSVSALARQYGGLNNAAAALKFSSVSALQNAIEDYCEA